MYFNLTHFRSITTFTMLMEPKNQVFLYRKREITQKLFILKLEPDLEKLSEHEARRATGAAKISIILSNFPKITFDKTSQLQANYTYTAILNANGSK